MDFALSFFLCLVSHLQLHVLVELLLLAFLVVIHDLSLSGTEMLLELKQLSLEAWVWEDDGSTLSDVGHCV